MATNYSRGRQREYRLCDKLRKEGFDLVQRSAGSHSPVDIFAIREQDNKILLVQAKPKSLSDNGKRKIEEANSWLNGEFEVEFIVE